MSRCLKPSRLFLIATTTVAILVLRSAAAGAPEPLATARSVKELPPNEAARQLPVRLKGLVTFYDPHWRLMFFQDATDGIYVNTSRIIPDLDSGQEVELTGVSERGDFRRVVTLSAVNALAGNRWPAPAPRTLAALWSGAHDSQWATIRGGVLHVEQYKDRCLLTMSVEGQRVQAYVIGLFGPNADALLYASVELSGAVGMKTDQSKLVTGVNLWVPGTNHLRVLDPAPVFLESLVPASIKELTHEQPASRVTGPVRVRGTVLHASSRYGIALADGPSAMFAFNSGSGHPAIGDEVEVIGWPGLRNGVESIDAATLRTLGRGTMPEPVTISLDDARNEISQGRLVMLEGVLRHQQPSTDEQVWILEQKGHLFEAVFPPGTAIAPEVAPGSVVQLTGVMVRDKLAAGRSTGICLLARSRSDVRVLAGPPWPVKRTLLVIAALAAAQGLALGALALMYLRLRRRSADLQSTRSALEHANQELESRVRERTSALSSANAALQESQSRFDGFMSTMPLISFIKDAEGRHVFVNRAFERTFGRSLEECRGRTDAELWPPEAARQFRANDLKVLRTGQFEIMEETLDTPAGRQYWLSYKFPFHDARGRLHIAGTAINITERKRNETFLQGERLVLEQIAAGAPLTQTLATLTRFLEAQMDGAVASLLLRSPDGKSLLHGAAPNLPAPFKQWLDGTPVAPSSSPCGTAAYYGRQIVIRDLAGEPVPPDYRQVALASGLAACVVTPFFGSSGGLLGTFAIYFRTPRDPTATEERLIHLAAQLALIAIERDQARQAERHAHERYRAIIDSAMDAIITVDDRQCVQVFNHAAERMFGWSETEAVGQPLDTFLPGASSPETGAASPIPGTNGSTPAPGAGITSGRGLRRNGAFFPIEASMSRNSPAGKTLSTFIVRDLTEREKADQARAQLESQLRQSQKMEAIGTLAGGIAHDFNNILGTVMLNIELACQDVPPEHPTQEYLAAIRASSLRARDLVRQILAFSQQQEQQRQIVRLEPIVEESLRLLRPALPSGIVIDAQLTSDGPSVLADPTQLHQVLMNLCANAAHAMRERGGRLEIRQRSVSVDSNLAARHPDLRPGSYVELSVADDGAGMTPEILDRIFDPFFTTKPPGEGTGLGLAVVHGIMKNHDGAVLVESTPGVGSTFRLLFPAIEAAPAPSFDLAPPVPRGSGEHLLCVDDEESLLSVHKRTLERLGYRVTACTSPLAALKSFRTDPGAFALVITDLAMPGMSGMELAHELALLRPACPVILTTGFTTSLDPRQARALGLADMIFKPVSTATLAESVHRALQTHHSI